MYCAFCGRHCNLAVSDCFHTWSSVDFHLVDVDIISIVGYAFERNGNGFLSGIFAEVERILFFVSICYSQMYKTKQIKTSEMSRKAGTLRWKKRDIFPIMLTDSWIANSCHRGAFWRKFVVSSFCTLRWWCWGAKQFLWCWVPCRCRQWIGGHWR